ncbi:fumarylacetoacetate hydrolase family protein [Candidatus Latescibacterota bacterium]
MRVYSLSGQDGDLLGLERDGVMIDLTKALSIYETLKTGFADDPIQYIETLIWEELLTVDFLGDVMECMSKDGLIGDLTVSGEYKTNAPLYPGKIIAVGQNYHKHIKEMNNTVPDQPVIFGKWPSTVIGQGTPILKPSWIGKMSYEAELAFVVGKRAKNVRAADAMQYVAGYTCLNDITARDIQSKDRGDKHPWMQSKNFDTFSPIGPCILPAGMVKEPVKIGVQCKVNGEQRQNGNTSDFIFDIPTVIEYITKIMALDPGDIVTTGTPEGVGAIEPGDVVEVTCDGIGTLTNPVESAE